MWFFKKTVLETFMIDEFYDLNNKADETYGYWYENCVDL